MNNNLKHCFLAKGGGVDCFLHALVVKAHIQQLCMLYMYIKGLLSGAAECVEFKCRLLMFLMLCTQSVHPAVFREPEAALDHCGQ